MSSTASEIGVQNSTVESQTDHPYRSLVIAAYPANSSHLDIPVGGRQFSRQVEVNCFGVHGYRRGFTSSFLPTTKLSIMKRRKNSNQRRLAFQSLERKCLMAGDLTNPVDPLDVNADDHVSAGDALVIINHIGRAGSAGEGELGSATNSNVYPDTNGDGQVTASDALRVINRLAEGEHHTEPSIDVTNVSFKAGSSPRVRANVSNATVTVTSSRSGLLTFSAAGMQETISIKQDLRIEISGSNNTLIFDGAIIPDDLFIDLSGGNHQIILNDTFVGDDFIFKGSHGSNVVILENGTIISDDAIVRGKDGNDDLIVNGARVNDDFFFYGGDGADRLIVDGLFVGDDAIVRLGRGNDAASIANTLVHDVADIEGDRGHDVLFAELGSVSARRMRPDEFEGIGQRIVIATIVFEDGGAT